MYLIHLTFPSGSDGKESACNTGDLGSIPGSGRSPGEGNGYPLQYSCLENSMDRAAWQATVHGVPKSWTQLSDQHFHFNRPNRLAQPILFRTLPLAYHLTQSLFYDKVLDISHNLLKTILKVKNRMTVCIQMVASVFAVYSCDCVAIRAAVCCQCQHHGSIIPFMASMGKDKNSKISTECISFHIVKSKSQKLGTICVSLYIPHFHYPFIH